MVPVDHQIYSKVSKPCHVLCLSTYKKHPVPVRDLNALYGVACLRMVSDRPGVKDCIEGPAGADVDPGSYPTEVEVGLPIGCLCRKANHGHHRYTPVDHNANIRNTKIADGGKDRTGMK